MLLSDVKTFCTYFKSRILSAISGYLNYKPRIISAIRGYLSIKTMLIYAFRGYSEFMWLFRDYWDILNIHLIEYHILHCKMRIVSHVAQLIFHGEFSSLSLHPQRITNVRKVEVYESKLLPNCGHFYTLFHIDKTEIIVLVR